VIAGTIGDELAIEEEGEIDGIFSVGGVDGS
jgi:hypothetical protein